jgi:hypothetical protein
MKVLLFLLLQNLKLMIRIISDCSGIFQNRSLSLAESEGVYVNEWYGDAFHQTQNTWGFSVIWELMLL